MRLLLDTHALIWALSSPKRLPASVRELLLDPSHEIVVSAVSAWEIAIKQSLGKLELPQPAERWLPVAIDRSGFGWLSVAPDDALRVRALPWHHRDPFDRLLIAQAMGGHSILTHDEQFRSYAVSIVWDTPLPGTLT